MRHTLLLAGRFLTASLLLAIGFGASGCGDSATVNPVVELASLSVGLTNGSATLQPGFSGGTTQYRVDVTTDVTAVTVTAQAAVAGDAVTIDGQRTTSRSVTLDPPGSTTVINIVVSETDTNSRTYVIRVVRAGLAGNNSLESLTVSPGTLAPTFDENLQSYTASVDNNVGSVTVTPTLSDTAATMTVNGQATNSGQASTITLNGGGQSTTITIIVTAQNGNSKTYVVTVSRGRSNNNNLQSLGISPGTLSPSFRAGTTGYTVNLQATLANNVTNVTVTPRLQDTAATMTVNGQTTNSGQARTSPLPAQGSNTFINIVVVAQDGTPKTYTVNVIRAAPAGNNNLSALTVSPGGLGAPFDVDDLNYTVSVASGVSSVAVTATRQDANASITVNGQATNSGQARTVNLGLPGQTTTIPIVVTAQNRSQKTYTVNVNRAALGANNNLQSLAVTPGSLVPAFTSGTTSYTLDVGSTVTSVSVTPTLQDTAATLTVTSNGQVTTSGQTRTITLRTAGLSTSINVAVTAPNNSSKTYTITVERAALGGNNNLQSLAVSPTGVNPSFTANTTSYSLEVGSGVSTVTVTPRLQDTTASMTVNGQATNSGQARTITLRAAGLNTLINTVVTAPNNSSKTYTITVERAALGGNNNLQNLTVSPGSLAPAFTAARTAYTVSVGSSATSILVEAAPQDSSATVEINQQAGDSRSIPLPTGPSSTEIEVRVIAPNSTDKTYLITVNQPAPAVPPAPTVAPDLIPQSDSCPLLAPPDPLDPNQCAPGTSREDNITNVNAPSFTIPQPGAGETPHLYVDGTKVKDGFDQGATTLTPPSALSDGVHSITSTVSNGGSESGQSPALSVTIDTGAPGTPLP